MIPELDLARIQRWVTARNSELSEEARDQVRLELDVTDRAVTIVECRPPWNTDQSSGVDEVSPRRAPLHEVPQGAVAVQDAAMLGSFYAAAAAVAAIVVATGIRSVPQ